MLRPRAWVRDYWRKFDKNPSSKPNKKAQRIARQYARAVGLPPIQRTPRVAADSRVSRAIAIHYEHAKSSPQRDLVRAAYNALVRETRAQYKMLPLRITSYSDNSVPPYRDSKEMMEDVRKGHLYVYRGGKPHGLLPPKDNFKFRAVHDYFGHAAGGFSFGPNGEENAWIEHAKMFSPLARMALTTETRGQNSWFNFGPHAKKTPDKRPYAIQKAIILPVWARTHPVLVDAYRGYPGFIE